MAERPVFYLQNDFVKNRLFEFEWYAGFSVAQKQRSVDSLHKSVALQQPDAKILEVSTKSKEAIGKKLSAFNLKIGDYYLENIFQSSKVFEHGGPYLDLLEMPPKDAKRDTRLRESGRLIGFNYSGESWPTIPKTVFYDFIYYQSVCSCMTLDDVRELEEYTYFTDIEFNPNKSINTQARSIALVRLILKKYGELIPIRNINDFIAFHKAYVLG